MQACTKLNARNEFVNLMHEQIMYKIKFKHACNELLLHLVFWSMKMVEIEAIISVGIFKQSIFKKNIFRILLKK